MYKNQLQELAQRSCFNLPSYTCIREGPDHAPRFKATVNFNGEIFESPHYCSTLRQAEHSAAEVALNSLSHRGPSHSLAAKILVSFFYLSMLLVFVLGFLRNARKFCVVKEKRKKSKIVKVNGVC
jgi:hypothetical protein